MIFTLEALRARHGDSLILHYGDPKKPRFFLIDGGPSGVYKDALNPRLEELRARWAPDARLPLEMVMVSHLDSDHVRGLLDLTNQVIEDQPTKDSPVDVGTLWLNAFDDIVGNGAQELAAALSEAPARVASAEGDMTGWKGDAEAVVASVPEGQSLRDNAAKLNWELNQHFDKLVLAPTKGGQVVDFDPLKVTVVGPLERELRALEAEWEKQLKKMKEAKKDKDVAKPADYVDKSIFNLSSIVCLVELGDKRMLLTGDARGDHIIEGLEAADLMDAGGNLEVDILKMAHHGSDRNVAENFFERIRARHYVASGDGGFGNPEPKTFEMLSHARQDDDFTLHLTYEDAKDGVGEALAAFFAKDRKAGRKYEVAFRDKDELSLRVDLLDPVSY